MMRTDALSTAGWSHEIDRLADRLQLLGRSFENSYEQLLTLRRVLEQINHGVSLDEVAEYSYAAFHELIPYDRIGLALIDESGERITARWAHSEALEVKLPVGFSAPLAGSSLQRILVTGKPRILDDLEAHLREHPNSESTRLIVAEGVRSSLTCPLIVNSKPVGFLFFSSMSKGTYRAAHVEVFEQIANTLSMMVCKSRALERLAGLNAELNKRAEELRESNARIERLMLTDELTGVANRRALNDTLQAAVAFGARHRQPLGLAMLDIDHFKKINDTHGHQAGDAVLTELADCLKSACRAEDTVARFGGEEFVVVLPGMQPESSNLVAERMRGLIEARSFLAGDVAVTVSIGVAQLRPGEDADDLLRRADALLYDAKEQGRNRVIAKAA